MFPWPLLCYLAGCPAVTGRVHEYFSLFVSLGRTRPDFRHVGRDLVTRQKRGTKGTLHASNSIVHHREFLRWDSILPSVVITKHFSRNREHKQGLGDATLHVPLIKFSPLLSSLPSPKILPLVSLACRVMCLVLSGIYYCLLPWLGQENLG